jgi:serine phosphatase RsbU (regulator of sigma subunit)/CHASE3 domain sensor protein
MNTPLVATLSFLMLLVVALLAGGIVLRGVIADSFNSADAIDDARMLVADLLEDQLDEETGIRGFAAADSRVMLQPYDKARERMSGTFDRVGVMFSQAHMQVSRALLDDARGTNARWLREIAGAVIAGHNSQPLELLGKRLVDHFRADLNVMQERLARREAIADDRAQSAIVWIGVFAAVAIAAVVFVALAFTLQQFRLFSRLEVERREAEEERRRSAALQAAYKVEKRIADTLQEAFVQNVLPRPDQLRFCAAFLPATEETLFGGDWYDVFELTGKRVLLTVGDVTGHGLEAAVTMNRTRQLFLSCALLDPEPGPLLARVNAHLVEIGSPLTTAVAAFVNAENYEFSYAVAGHPPPVLAEPGRKPRLLETGSLPLGVLDTAAFETRTVQSVPGAMLVLYTDGLIEHSRDVLEGEVLLLDAIEQAVLRPSEDAATVIRDAILGGHNISDDVAILTMRFGEGSNPAPSWRAQ